MLINKEQKRQITKLIKFDETDKTTTKIQNQQSVAVSSGKNSVEKGQFRSSPMSLNSTMATTPNLASILEQRRKVREMDLEISPEVAATVVKQYLLPMFQADNKHINDKKRKALIGKNSETESENLEKVLEPIKGTVLAELKLSDKLMAELKAAKQELREAKQKLKDLEQSSIGMQEKVYLAQHQKLQSEVDVQLINYQGNLNFQDNSTKSVPHLVDQLDSMNLKYNESEIRRQEFANLLHNEKAITDKLNNKGNELEHGNAILRLENDIMGERLKNLYKSINEILNRKFLEERVQIEIQLLSSSLRNLMRFHNELIQKFSQILYDRDKIQEDLLAMTKYRQELIIEHNKFLIRSKEKISKLESTLETTKEENLNLTMEVTDLNKRNADLSQQYEQLRSKMKQYKSRFNKYAVSEEKICKNCNKYYVEKENFNWSCNTHHSQWNEDNKIYFCCGETSQGAIGCRIQKHESKDDEDEEDLKEKEEIDKRKAINIKCNLCNEIGHKTIECGRDPNIRTNYEIHDELKRINALKNKKKNKNQFEVIELRKKMMEQMEQKCDQQGFGINQVSSLYLTDSDQESYYEAIQENKQFQNANLLNKIGKYGSSDMSENQKEKFIDLYVHKKGFEDILALKPEPMPQNSLIKVEIMITKEYFEVQSKNKQNKIQTTTNINDLCKFVSGVANTFQFANESLQDNTKQSEQSLFEAVHAVKEGQLKKKPIEDLSSARTNDDQIIFSRQIFSNDFASRDEQPDQENTKELEFYDPAKLKYDQEDDSLSVSSPKIKKGFK